MKKNNFFRWLLVFFMGAFIFSGCTDSENTTEDTMDSEDGITIGVSFQTLQHEFFVDLKDGIEEAAEENNINIIFSDANFEFSKQQSAMEDFAAQNVDAVLVVPVNSESISSAIESVQKEGIPVITLDIGSEEGVEDIYIASDNYYGGQIAAEYLVDTLGIEEGNLFIMTAQEDLSIREREEGFKEVLEDYPNIDIVTDQHGGIVRDKALEVTENVLQANPDLTLIFSANDEMTMGALNAVEAANKSEEITIIGYDLSADIEKAILSGGPLKAVAAQQPKLIGKTGIIETIKIINGEETSDQVDIEVYIADEESLK